MVVVVVAVVVVEEGEDGEVAMGQIAHATVLCSLLLAAYDSEGAPMGPMIARFATHVVSQDLWAVHWSRQPYDAAHWKLHREHWCIPPTTSSWSGLVGSVLYG